MSQPSFRRTLGQGGGRLEMAKTCERQRELHARMDFQVVGHNRQIKRPLLAGSEEVERGLQVQSSFFETALPESRNSDHGIGHDRSRRVSLLLSELEKLFRSRIGDRQFCAMALVEPPS